jgi:hypothetical protein
MTRQKLSSFVKYGKHKAGGQHFLLQLISGPCFLLPKPQKISNGSNHKWKKNIKTIMFTHEVLLLLLPPTPPPPPWNNLRSESSKRNTHVL